MTKATLTVERLREVYAYAPETGLFTRRIDVGRHGAHKAGVVASQTNKGYVFLSVDSRRYEAQRLAWLYMTGEWPKGEVDHRDTDPGNNRWSNLRDVSHQENMENRRRANKQNRTGLLGVTPVRKRPGYFRAQISTNGRNKWLGEFKTPEEAHAAYVVAKRDLHKGNQL